MSEGITLTDVRPEVAAFALAMERKLRENDWKGGWQNDAPEALLERLYDEAQELSIAQVQLEVRALESPDPAHAASNRRRVLDEAADVANFALMVADVCGALR
jgi:NTP pyrophosphatase (non-canonical NTP hydrolase)